MSFDSLDNNKYTVSVEDPKYFEILKRNKRNIDENKLNHLEIIEPIVLTHNVERISFNLFGCWNSVNNNTLINSDKSSFKDAKSLPILSDMIHHSNIFLKPTFTVIVGDNYYSSNDNNIGRNINTGFDLLAKDDNPHFILFGNHDVESNEVILEQLKKTYNDMTTNFSTNPVNINFGRWILPSANYILKIKSNHISCYIVMMDTNMFTDDFVGLTNDKTSTNNVLSFLDKTLHQIKNSGLVFFAGHHPFFAFGHKPKNPIIQNEKLDEVYDLMIKHNVKFYLCADEHNFQYIYDSDNDIHHVLSAGSSSGDESFTYMHHQQPFDSRGTRLPIKGRNLFGKMIINSPHFVNISVDSNNVDIKVISLAVNQNHSFEYLKENCSTVGSLNTIESLQKYYSIVYNIQIPKYIDFIYISNCGEYIKRIEKEIGTIKLSK